MAGVTFLPIQAGTGDPSPTNVRPISPGLTITGIGDIYGGYLDVAHGTVVETWGHVVLDGTENVATSQYHYLGLQYKGYTHLTTDVAGMCSWCPWMNQVSTPPRMAQGNTTTSIWLWLPSDSPMYDNADAFKAMCAELYAAGTPFEYAYETTNTTTHSLTSAQLAEAMQKLNVHSASMLERRRRIVMAQPHLVTPTPANPVSFAATLAAPLKALECAFAPVQAAGTPAPDNVLPISGWTGCNVVRCGTNLWDEQWESGSIWKDGLDIPDNTRIRSKNYIPISPNTAYYYKTPTTIGLRYYDRNKTHLGSSTNVTVRNGAKTSPANAYYLRFLVVETTTYNNDISINYPATDTEYHPYTGQTLAVQFPATKNLCKLQYSIAGNAGYKDLTDNSVTVYSNITSAGYKWVRFKCADVSPLGGKSVTFSCKAEQIVGTSGMRVIGALFLNGTKVGSNIFEKTSSNVQETFTIPSNVEAGTEFYVTFYCNSGTAEATEASYTECQLELGSTATPTNPTAQSTAAPSTPCGEWRGRSGERLTSARLTGVITAAR